MSLLGKTVFPRLSMCMQVSRLINSSLPSRNRPCKAPFDSQIRKTESVLRYSLTNKGSPFSEPSYNGVYESNRNNMATLIFVYFVKFDKVLREIDTGETAFLGK